MCAMGNYTHQLGIPVPLIHFAVKGISPFTPTIPLIELFVNA
jgi:hypothetical protein